MVPTEVKRSSTKILSTIDPDKCVELLKDVEQFVKCKKIKEVCNVINTAWENKKQISTSITNEKIETLDIKLKSFSARKLLGAGGGGYFLLIDSFPYQTSSWYPPVVNPKKLISIKVDYKGVIAKKFG